MKMTPEQKAFFEYGELFQLWKDARRCVFWHEESHEDIRREIVQKVWQKRVPGAQGQAHTIIRGAGHFLQEDKGPELAHAIVAFVHATPSGSGTMQP